ncbi:hypothetical protein [Ralstonia thomasii]|jgi:hypothetical protein|uniref:Uncharacterized protein n=1 Tax=Ralstonia thomasii TaxID=3058596 RepID=A0ABM9JVR3_9RALS|nr:hypothetical protein [Ralstonia sp. LMG 18095]CAJ0805134.1 hypothetical protein LMG18095_04206 [Ralstonia sp. LMG 18095]
MKKTDSDRKKSTVDLKSLDDAGLLDLRSAVDREARLRGLSFNVGEIGEKLAIALFKERSDLPILAPAPRGTKNIDAISRDGNRYSIKTLQRAKKTGTIYPDPVDKHRRLFEFILIIMVDEEFSLERVIELDWDQFCSVRSWDVRMNAWYVARSHRALSIGRQIYPKVEEQAVRISQSCFTGNSPTTEDVVEQI